MSGAADLGEPDDADATDGWLPVEGVGEPAERVEIADLAVLREATHPVRGLLLRRFKQPHTVAEVATAMDVPVTRLYHHVNRLVDAGLIRVVATRQVAAVTERRYQVTALSHQLDGGMFDTIDRRELAEAMGSIFDLAKLGFQRLVETKGANELRDGDDASALSLGEIRIPLERRKELLARIEGLIEEFQGESDDESPDAIPFTLFVAAYPDPTR